MSYAINQPPLKTIRLGGALGKKFGRVHRMAVNSPAEAIRALTANYPDFETFMREGDEAGVGWRVKIGADDLAGLDHLHDPMGRDEIRFIPVVCGKGKGIFEIFAGVALIAASFFIPAGFLVAGISISSLAFSVGVALVLGGISSLLAPHPKTQPSNQASYAFGGAVNTLAAGMPVPIGYGELIVGGAIISAGVTTDQVSTSETGVAGLSAIVQEIAGAGGAVSYQLYASWQPAGLAVGYDVTIQGPFLAPTTLPTMTATSFYYTVTGPGPYEVIVNPKESDGSHGPGATVWSAFVGE